MLLGRRRRPRATDPTRAPRPPAGEHAFTIVRNGYSTVEVAAFLTEISSDTTVLRPQDLRRVTFQVYRRGYDKAEVNAYLARVTAELEAELEDARARLRAKRLANIDPDLAATEPAPPALTPQPIQSARPTEPSQPEILWVEPDETDEPNETDEPIPAATEEEAPAVDVDRASTEISDLLRRSHETAVRLRAQAESDVRATIDAAQNEVDQRKRSQLREIEHERHAAETEIRRMRAEAEAEADSLRTAARAVLTQAKAEIAAVKALADHNMAEITETRDRTMEESREMLMLGRGMLQIVIDLDRSCAARLARSRRTVKELLGDGAN